MVWGHHIKGGVHNICVLVNTNSAVARKERPLSLHGPSLESDAINNQSLKHQAAWLAQW